MFYFIGYFRQVVMYGAVPDLRTNLVCAAFAIGFLLLGMAVFKSRQDRFILFL
jgi:ABC-2 type transport system permease protein